MTFTAETSVHRVRFYEPDNLKEINSMAMDTQNKKIAVVRKGFDDNSTPATIIEIWDIKYTAFIELKIYENDREPTLIEDISWGANGRLFSCGCDGHLNEYNLLSGCFKQRYDISTGPLWTLAINTNGTKLACGSEDGSISIVDLVEEGFGDVRLLRKMSSRVMSVTWMKNSNKVIAGSEGNISIYDYKLRQLLEKIELDKNCKVWSLATFEDTIVSGDSKGYTSFWCAKTATLINKFNSHKSDVLTVCASDEGYVYSSGIDPVIAQFDVKTTKPLIPLNVHTHDVRALVVDKDGSIYSGGQDIALVRTSIRPKSVTKFAYDLSDCIDLWENILLIRYLKEICLFEVDTKNIATVPEVPTKMVSIKSSQNIVATAFNSNWVMYSCYKEVSFVNYANEFVKLRHTLDGVVQKMSFLDNETLALATSTKLQIVSLKFKDQIKEIAAHQFEHRITSLSSCSNSIAIALSNHELIYMPNENWNPISVSKLPSIPSAMSFNPYQLNKLYVCCSNKVICKFNLENGNLKMDNDMDLTRLEFDHYFRGMTFTSESVIIYTDSGLYSFDPSNFSFKTRVSEYKSIVAAKAIHRVKPPQMVLVELAENRYFNLLPPALMKKVYGTE